MSTTRIRFLEVTHDGDAATVLKAFSDLLASGSFAGGQAAALPAVAPAALPQADEGDAPIRRNGKPKSRIWTPERLAKAKATRARNRALRDGGDERSNGRGEFPDGDAEAGAQPSSEPAVGDRRF